MEFPFLQKTSLWAALSSVAKPMETPKGIFYWSGRAKTEAEIDGTIGIAQDDDGTLSHLKIAELWAGEAVMKRVPKGKIFGYAPIEGLESLRKKWLAKIAERHPEAVKFSSLPLVTNGITHSLALAGRLFLNPGERLITADKSWENYEHIYTDAQEVAIDTFPLFTTSTGSFNGAGLLQMIENRATTQTKVVLLLNFPHNQTGFMPSHEELKNLGNGLQALCKKYPRVSFVALLDDAYEGYVYDETGQKFSPLSEIFAPLQNLTVTKMDGISKVMLAYGYRVGFITLFGGSIDGSSQAFSQEFLSGFRSEVGSKIGGFVRAEISQANHHGQILADALMDDWNEVSRQREEVIERLHGRWRVFVDALKEGYKKYGRDRLWADPCNGGFFGYVNLVAGMDSKQVADRLLKEKKVGVVPGPQGLRVAFCGVAKEKIGRMVEAVFEIAYV